MTSSNLLAGALLIVAKLLLAPMLSYALAEGFGLGMDLSNFAFMYSMTPTAPNMHLYAAWYGLNDEVRGRAQHVLAKLKKEQGKATKYLLALVFPIIVALCLLTPAIIRVVQIYIFVIYIRIYLYILSSCRSRKRCARLRRGLSCSSEQRSWR